MELEWNPFLAVIIMSYFLYDTLFTMPDWLRYPDQSIHHFLGVTFVWAYFMSDAYVL